MFPVISPKLPRLPELLAKLSLRLRKVEGESAQVLCGMAMSGCSAKMVIWCDCISRAKIRDSTWFLWNKPRFGINLPSIDPVVSICIHVFTVDMFDPWAIPKNIIGLTHHPSDYPMTSPANAHRIQVDGRTASNWLYLILPAVDHWVIMGSQDLSIDFSMKRWSMDVQYWISQRNLQKSIQNCYPLVIQHSNGKSTISSHLVWWFSQDFPSERNLHFDQGFPSLPQMPQPMSSTSSAADIHKATMMLPYKDRYLGRFTNHSGCLMGYSGIIFCSQQKIGIETNKIGH